jgi:hypothetical protein
MTPDDAVVAITSLGFASVFLALVIGMTDGDAKSLIASIANHTPAAKKQARMARLQYLTSVADEAMEARRTGKRLGRWEGS